MQSELFCTEVVWNTIAGSTFLRFYILNAFPVLSITAVTSWGPLIFISDMYLL